MDRWQNKIAVVTGASAGIGEAICKALVDQGMIVVGLARRVEKMENQIKPALAMDKQQNFYCYKCDVSDEESVKQAFNWIEGEFGGIHVLVNNAGVLKQTSLVAENNSEDIKTTINTNVFGTVWCVRAAFHIMKSHNIDGHIIIINSVVGHSLTNAPGYSLNIYRPSKHAITAMIEVLRQELLANKTRIKITSVSPGAVFTEIMGEGVEFPSDIPSLNGEDVADAVVFCIQTPPHVQIHELTIRPVGETLF